MKTWLAVAVVALSGCKEKGASVADAGSRRTLALVTAVANEPFSVALACGAFAEAKALGYELEVQAPPRLEPAVQASVVNTVTLKKPEAVLVAPVDAEALTRPLRTLADEGSRVVLVDTEVNDETVGVSRISSNNVQGGALGARALASLLPDGGFVLVLGARRGVAVTDDRVLGFKDALADFPKVKVVGEQYPGDDALKAEELVSALLVANPKVSAIFAASPVVGTGAAAALKAAGKTGAVKLVEFDATPTQVESLRAGTVQALIAQRPWAIGQAGVQQAVRALEGKLPPPRVQTELVEVNAQNVDTPAMAKVLYRGCDEVPDTSPKPR